MKNCAIITVVETLENEHQYWPKQVEQSLNCNGYTVQLLFPVIQP